MALDSKSWNLIALLVCFVTYMITSYSFLGQKYKKYQQFTPSKRRLFDVIHVVIVLTNILFYISFAYIVKSSNNSYMLDLAGYIIFVCGVVLILISIWYIGFSTFFQEQGSKLIQRGPYRYVRHPIYSGGIIGATGLCFAASSILLYIYLVTLIIMLRIIAKKEEAELHERFGMIYKNYLDATGMFIPCLKFFYHIRAISKHLK